MQKRIVDLRQEFRITMREFRFLLEAAREAPDMREKISLQRNAMVAFGRALELTRKLASFIGESHTTVRRASRRLRA